ncbi:MAG: CRISPR system precrRNA processing endoribonuclease RAMP protein Cas6 [Candidatus Bipolaricaulota bacterium]|nr:CRISPR system precrRNA processing endoribonuclease RAMP protein Cas6 [Candidatus Bipolaricaulota bacterium]MCX7844902.1 CRISPR system precrRNA processing endoribonuclease RAMP protein Cas6 [Candidatus Bipolaricaulota bacterium]MDW8151803.1 CRISPR system precrRNA processing endoribonuclease RAMP protein Cas6 [Candidatus Bipolaricaulota bacterium]
MEGPYAVVLGFRAGQPVEPPVPEALHAAFLDLVRRADPALAATLHAPGHRLRPYTLALLGPRGGLTLRLRLSVLAPELFVRFWERWERRGGFPLRLGRQWLAPVARETRGAWAGQVPWAAFAHLAPVHRVRLAFCTPTTFRQGDLDLPLPVPKLLFAGLLAKWNAAAPQPLALEPEAFERHVGLTLTFLRTRPVWDGRARIWGFVGWAEFGVRREAPAEVRRGLAVLAAFAPYAGAGRRTTHGLGLVRLLHAA